MKVGETGVVILSHNFDTTHVTEIIVTMSSVSGSVVKKLSENELTLQPNNKIVIPLTQDETSRLGRKSDTEVKTEAQIVFDGNPPTVCKTDIVTFTLSSTLGTEFIDGASGTEQQLNEVTISVNAGVIYARVNPDGVEEVVEQKVSEAMGDYPTTTEVQQTVADYVTENRDTLKGDDGLSAYDSAVASGFDGTLEEWIASLHGTNGTNGTDGKSAYQSALDGGYTGSEAEFNSALASGMETMTAEEMLAILNGGES